MAAVPLTRSTLQLKSAYLKYCSSGEIHVQFGFCSKSEQLGALPPRSCLKKGNKSTLLSNIRIAHLIKSSIF